MHAWGRKTENVRCWRMKGKRACRAGVTFRSQVVPPGGGGVFNEHLPGPREAPEHAALIPDRPQRVRGQEQRQEFLPDAPHVEAHANIPAAAMQHTFWALLTSLQLQMSHLRPPSLWDPISFSVSDTGSIMMLFMCQEVCAYVPDRHCGASAG